MLARPRFASLWDAMGDLERKERSEWASLPSSLTNKGQEQPAVRKELPDESSSIPRILLLSHRCFSHTFSLLLFF